MKLIEHVMFAAVVISLVAGGGPVRAQELELEKERAEKERPEKEKPPKEKPEKEKPEKEKPPKEKPLKDPRGGDDAASSEVLIDRIGKLRKEAVRAKREGDLDRAKEMWSEADKLDRELRAHMGGPVEGKLRKRPPGEEDVRALKEKTDLMAREAKERQKELLQRARELKDKAEAVAREGQSDERERFLREARDVEEKAHLLARQYKEKSELLRRDAEEAKEAAQRALAKEEVYRRSLEKDPRGRSDASAPAYEAPQELRREIERLRSEVRELREVLKKSLEDRRDRDRERGRERREEVQEDVQKENQRN